MSKSSPETKKILICFGTRPEAIKLAPLVHEFLTRSNFDVKVCITSQHRHMLDQVLNLFDIIPHIDLNLMTPGQTLEAITTAVIKAMAEVLEFEQPDCIIVQGDTTTTFAAAISAFYKRINVAHVEAGLRTYDRFSPFPEEMNRQMTSCLTRWHFPPTHRAQEALIKEGHHADSIFTVGNTVIDSLLSILEKLRAEDYNHQKKFDMIRKNSKILLVTGHRRENFGDGFRNICRSISKIANNNPDLDIVYPVHLNPNVQEPVFKYLSNIHNVHLIEPQDYLSFVWLLDRCHIVLTDSGGVQEEAPSIGKPVLVLRETTERPEAVEAGVAKLVGTKTEDIVYHVQQLLDDQKSYNKMSQSQNPYGDGTSSRQIVDILENKLFTSMY